MKRDQQITWSLVSCAKMFQFHPKKNGGTIENVLFCFKDLGLIIFDLKRVILAGIRRMKRMNVKWVRLEAGSLSKR